MKKNFFAAALALGTATLASALLSAPAKAVDANVDLIVDIPDIIYLETYQSLTFTPTLADLSTGAAAAGSPIQTQTGEVDFATGTVNTPLSEGATVTGFTPDKDVDNVLVYKTWGIGGTNGNIAHSATFSGTSLTKAATTSSVGLTVTQAGTGSDTAPGLDYTQAIEGRVNFAFDFSGVTASGIHDQGATLTITATAE